MSETELYNIFKVIHVVSGATLFAAVFITFGYITLQKTISKHHIEQAIRLSWFVALPALFIQVLSGFTIIGLQHYSIRLDWVWGTFSGFLLFTLVWLRSVYCLTEARHDNTTYYLKHWKYSVISAFVVLLVMLFLMANKIA